MTSIAKAATPTPDLTLVHLSDLHFAHSKSSEITPIFEALLEDIVDVANKTQHKPAMICFSGDLVKSGDVAKDFELVKTGLIDKLADRLALSTSRFYYAPGNHDVQRAEIDRLTEPDVGKWTADDLSMFLARPSHEPFAKRFANFQLFLDSHKYEPTEEVGRGDIWRSYLLNIAGRSVGVVCLNTAWCTSLEGSRTDYGRLKIGLTQVEASAKSVGAAELKICLLHHPPEYWSEVDRESTRMRLFQAFDVVLCGHNHLVEPFSHASPFGSTVVSAGGALYQSRYGRWNGYSILTWHFDDAVADVRRREYQVATGGFVPDTRGGSLIRLRRPNVDSSKAVVLHSEKVLILLPKVKARLERRLFSTSANSRAPRALEEIFVEPCLSDSPERGDAFDLSGRTQQSQMSIDEIMRDDKNVMLVGSRETGKSTILHSIALRLLSRAQTGEMRLPFYVDLGGRPIDEATLLRMMSQFSEGMWTSRELQEMLDAGRCVLLLDNVGPQIVESVARAPKFAINRVIAATDESALAVFMESLREIGIDNCTHVYVHGLSRKRVRALCRTWMGGTDEHAEDVSKRVVKYMQAIGVPCTPFMVSLFLWVIESYDQHLAMVNHVALVDRVVNGLLERLAPTEGLRRAFDYRDKEHFLAAFAGELIRCDQQSFGALDAEQFALDYLRRRELTHIVTTASELLSYFVARGVLIDEFGRVSFKYRCYLHYFQAKYFADEDAVFKRSTSYERIFQFVDTLDYYSGLNRNSDYLLETAVSTCQKSLTALGIRFVPEDFDAISILSSRFSSARGREIRQRMTDGGFRAISESVDDSAQPAILDQQERRPTSDNNLVRAALATELLSRVARNSELVKTQAQRRTAFLAAVDAWTQLGLYMLYAVLQLSSSDADAAEFSLDGSAAKGRDRARYTAASMVPLVVEFAAGEALGSEKITPMFVEALGSEWNCSNERDYFKILLLVKILLALDPDKALNFLKTKLDEIAHHRFALELLIQRLLGVLVMERLNADQTKVLEALILEALALSEMTGNRLVANRAANQRLQEVKKGMRASTLVDKDK